jgi:hypothetical protein
VKKSWIVYEPKKVVKVVCQRIEEHNLTASPAKPAEEKGGS